jgi:flagellin
MSQVINTNIGSLNAQRALTGTQEAQRLAMERLSSGKRINTARDDAAGLAISNSMTAQVQGLNQAIRNSNDGISLVQTAEGAMSEITTMLQRIRELKVQASNGTNNSTQVDYLDKEFAQLADEIGGVIETTKFNGLNILSGGSSGITVHKGWEDGDTMSIGMSSLQSAANITAVTGTIDDTSGSAATSTMDSVSLTQVDAAIKHINEQRVNLGAQQNRLEHNVSNLANVSENISAARSRIQDADFAAESAELARTSVLQQAGMAMLSQANQTPASVLSLLS